MKGAWTLPVFLELVCNPALSSCSIIVTFEFDREEITYAKVVPRIPAPIITIWLLFMIRHSFLYPVLFLHSGHSYLAHHQRLVNFIYFMALMFSSFYYIS